MNSTREGFKPQTLLFREKECQIVSYKEKILHRLYGYYDKHWALQDGVHKDSLEECKILVQTVEQYIGPPSDVDIEMSVSYLLTYSMVQSPSWETNWFAASQEIPRI